jgi:uncharacterized protein
MATEFEWDESKRRTNLRKHGIDFVDCEAVFKGSTLTIEDTRFDYGERRFVTFGLLKGRVVSVVHTETARKIRVISVRKATRSEQESYFENFAD